MDMRAAIRPIIWRAMRVPLLSQAVMRYYKFRPPSHFPGWNHEHPFDHQNGVDTSGALPGGVLGPGTPAYGAAPAEHHS